MILTSSPAVGVWTDEGRNDTAAGVALTQEGDTLCVTVEDKGMPLVAIALRWPLPMSSGVRILGDHWERGYGDLEWRGTVPERVMPWYVLLHDPQKEQTTGFGVETGGNAIASWQVDGRGITLTLDIRSGGKGVHLNGRPLPAATIHAIEPISGESAYQAARRLCARLCPNPSLPTFPIYGGNDWYYIYGNNTAQTILRDAALMRDLAPSRDNAPFMVIDAGWFPGKGCNGGPYDQGNANFPDMPGLAREMKAMDVRPGVWIRPLLTSEEPPAVWQMPENHPVRHRGEKGYFLDPTVPEVRELVRTDVARLASWGYELIKHDFTTFDITGRWGFEMASSITRNGWGFADNSRTTAEVIHDLYRLIREAAGDVPLIGCNTIGHLGAGLFELQRTGDDTSGREWERTRKMGVNTLAFRMPQHNTFFAADADCVGLTDRVPWEKNRQWLDILARSGTPLFVSADPAAVGAEQRAALRDAFALAATARTPAEPLDWMDTTSPRRWKCAEGATREYDWSHYFSENPTER
jgi:alpha-galactosidase